MPTKAAKPKKPTRVASDLPPKPAGTKWTDAQWAGVATTGKSLLVSAAAGSGKTAVLAERCAFLVCDAPEKCDVDELLVVTFTEAAAAEMKGRIEKALHEKIRAAPGGADQRLSRQLALIDRAQVSTLHGFCAKLIRQHFHLLDLDPAFTVLDGDEAALLRTEIAREIFEERYEAPDSEAFRALVDGYPNGNDEQLVARVIGAHELLTSVVDPADWMEKARRRIAEPREATFRASVLGSAIENEIRRSLDALRRSCQGSLAVVSGMAGFNKYVADLKSNDTLICQWQEILAAGGIDALAQAAQVELPRLPSVPESTPGKKVAKALVDAVRDQIKSGPLRQTLAFSTKQWCDGLARILPHAEVFLDLVKTFGGRYAAAKAAVRGVDFADLERFALRALRDPQATSLAPSTVARLLHKQFAHVLVDEYQDINEVQNAILHLASRECLGGKCPGNLFCVGDVKQSIYRFRLAEPKLFLDRESDFRAAASSRGSVIDLQANFRSRAPLLQALNGVFWRLMTAEAADIQYDDTHKLIPGAKDYPAGDAAYFTGSPIELHVLPDKLEADGHADPADAAASEEPDRTQREAMLIAQRIRALTGAAPGSRTRQVWDKDKKICRDIAFGDIVILLRSMRHKGDHYADVLRRSGIPVHSESGTGYFDSMEVQDVLALLKVLDNRAQDIPLAAVLRSPISSIPGAEDALATIRLTYEKSVPFHRAVVRYANEQDDELAAALRDVLARLDHWRTMAQRRPLAELIWDVYDSTGYLAFCAGLRDGEQRKANLIDLHDRARQFGSFQRQGLARFLAFLDQLREESDLGQPPVVSEGENVVRIMTVHHSKGLEFPVVFLPDLGKRINLTDCSGPILLDRHAYLGMEVVDEAKQVRYPSLASTLVSRRLRKQAMAEELRVLYVAMTRAKEHLILIGTCKESAPDGWQARWGNHKDQLPADAVQNAGCMLEWLGPVAAAMAGGGDAAIELIPHPPQEIKTWPAPESLRPTEGERQERLARLQRLAPEPPKDAKADAIIARLTAPYAFERFTKLPAVEAATVLGKSRVAAPVIVAATAGPGETSESLPNLELPRAVQTSIKPSAADVGSATHLVLQHLDFDQPCDAANLKSQLDLLVNRRLIAAAAAKSVDLDALCWLRDSFVGRMFRDPANEVRRELPLYLAIDPDEFDPAATSTTPEDRVMVRSRVDALLRTKRGDEIVDYKTDHVTAATLPARVETYRPQMNLYRRAIEAITGQPVAAVHLVFLSIREIVTVR